MYTSTLTEHLPTTNLQIDSPFMEYAYNEIGETNLQYKPIVNRILPELTEIDEQCTFGVFSRRLTQSKITLLEVTSSIDIAGEYSSATKVSRLYLDYWHKKPLRNFGSQVRAIQQSAKHVPLYVSPCTLRDASYVDIKSMYFTSVLNLGWNVDYYPDVWLTPGRAPLDFPMPNAKVARSYLVTQSYPATCGYWDGKSRAYYKSIRNVHTNYTLIACIMAILHSVAQYAIVNCHAVYCHTDGMIVPSQYSEKLIQYIRMFGYQATIKHRGETIVKGMSNFLCGERTTMGFDPSKAAIPLDRIDYSINRIWMLNNVSKAIDSKVSERLYNKSMGDYNR